VESLRRQGARLVQWEQPKDTWGCTTRKDDPDDDNENENNYDSQMEKIM